ncbi:MAG: hypothetical protein ACYTGX_09320 [Planctomycetota bacterium]|jgi:hypothetical protein
MSDDSTPRDATGGLSPGRIAFIVGASITVIMLLLNWPSRNRMGINEDSAIGTLRWIASGQEQFRRQGVVDLDGDGEGEFGFIGELAATGAIRGGATVVGPFVAPVLGISLKPGGIAEKSGYYFKLYLPTATGSAVAEPGGGDAAPAVKADADAQEQRWCCYAWPIQRSVTGIRAFWVNQQGNVYVSDNAVQQYSGVAKTPEPETTEREGNPDGPRPDGGSWLPVGG